MNLKEERKKHQRLKILSGKLNVCARFSRDRMLTNPVKLK